MKPALLDNKETLLDARDRIYSEIEEHVEVVERHALRAKGRAQWPFQEANVKQLKSRLEAAKATLNLMVNILTLSANIISLE